ncbi:hypothetical protein [Caballeronia hypogeia]|uniref:hypothetical protein n=1 Tax=Caballeronia hypogeia TaxID=1777140 RepID=UPI0018E00695|nr:hypothetical protein [Caballeronia hypogeia]
MTKNKTKRLHSFIARCPECKLDNDIENEESGDKFRRDGEIARAPSWSFRLHTRKWRVQVEFASTSILKKAPCVRAMAENYACMAVPFKNLPR